MAPVVLLAGFLSLPGRSEDGEALRRSYVKHLRGFEGTRYVWGGENARGIDCSGLVRQGLVRANLERGFVSLNPRLVRRGLEMMWYDCSAKALSERYRGWTVVTGAGDSINVLSRDGLKAGDLAVTKDGVHVLAYAGAGDWIQASPGEGRVLSLPSPSSNSWYEVPVVTLRWTQLEKAHAGISTPGIAEGRR